MTPRDEILVRNWTAAHPSFCPVIQLSARQGMADRQMDDFCRALARAAPNLKLVRNPEQAFCTPAIIIGPHANIAYQAVPLGPELKPFLEALSAGAGGNQPPIDPKIGAMLRKLTQPVDFTLYISAQCPHCPQAVRSLWQLAVATPLIRLAIVDAALFEARARAHGVRSVPLLILDEEAMRWSGQPDLAEVLTVCLERDPSLISPTSLRRIIEAGDAGRAASMMVAEGHIFPALISLLTDEKWSVRLGAMVTVEYLADTAPELAGQLIAPLWEVFGDVPPQVQGDVALVLGTIGSDNARDCLQTIITGPYDEDVVQAAAEALEELEGGK